MSNKTQLQTNNTTLDGYIARINAAKDVAAELPEAGSGGGGSVEACTVEIVHMSNTILHLVYIDADTGSYKYLQDLNENTTTINCVCNTSITLILTNPVAGYSIDNMTNLIPYTSWFTFGLDAPANGVATITLMTSAGGGSGGS